MANYIFATWLSFNRRLISKPITLVLQLVYRTTESESIGPFDFLLGTFLKHR